MLFIYLFKIQLYNSDLNTLPTDKKTTQNIIQMKY
jgi:hypothetical protein